MNITHIRNIIAIIYSDLNIPDAANRVGLTPAAIGKQLRNFEEILGFRIFKRKGKKLSGITDEGMSIIESLERILGEFDNMMDLVAKAGKTRAGHLRIFIAQDQLSSWVETAVVRFCRLHPETSVELLTSCRHGSPSPDAPAFDIAITGERPSDIRVAGFSFPAYRCSYMAVVAKGHPLEGRERIMPDELARYPIAIPAADKQLQRALNSSRESTGAVRLHAANEGMLSAYITAGHAVGIMGAAAFFARSHGYSVVPFDMPGLGAFETWITINESAPSSPATFKFIEAIAPHVPINQVIERRHEDLRFTALDPPGQPG